MISALALQEDLKDNVDAITQILIELGCPEESIKYHKSQNMISSVRPEEGADNKNGCILYCDSLFYKFMTRSGQGSLFSLVMDVEGCTFPQALERICEWTGIRGRTKRHITYPFDGFYKDLIRNYGAEEDKQKVYKKSDLPSPLALSEKFLNDGISLQVQEEWGIRYDLDGNNILIPIEDSCGRLVGCKARRADPDISHDKRWFAYLSYSKTQNVYGYVQNYSKIIHAKIVFIFEAEKSVLQCASFGFCVAVAIGGHSFSQTQVKLIKSLMTEKIIVAFDADICEDEVKFEAKKLQQNTVFSNRVGYILDENHDLLGEKDSPSDKGVDVFKKLIKNYVRWL